MIKIYNSLTREKEEFKPRAPGKVKMYACGVTVYDNCHIGHARSLYVFEVIKNYLRYRGFKVSFVRNITDVDDKIINKAREVSGAESISLKKAFDKVRKTYIDSYYKDLEELGLSKANKEPLATKNIKQMQAYIQGLINKGFAYAVDGNVYFSVRKFSSYGKLSGKKIDDLISSVRIEEDPLKKDPLDFALWKKAKAGEPYWNSPWGRGRPGWHIECSVMSQKYLKTDTLDIHGGGRDLIFPHHENELTQSESLTGKPFANYWIHHGLLTINGQKMAKSLGNFVTVKDLLKKCSADIVKLFFLGAHYSQPIDFSWDKLEDTKKAYERIAILIDKIDRKVSRSAYHAARKGNEEIQKIKDQFIEAMDDDFNMPQALAVIFEVVNAANKNIGDLNFIAAAKGALKELLGILGIFLKKDFKAGSLTKGFISEDEIKNMISERNHARKNRDFKLADEIRKDLEKKGVILEDTKDGTLWRRKL